MILKVEYTEQEAGALLQLIDLAVKSAGMQAAAAGVVFTQKINEAGKAAQAEAEAAKKSDDAAVPRV